MIARILAHSRKEDGRQVAHEVLAAYGRVVDIELLPVRLCYLFHEIVPCGGGHFLCAETQREQKFAFFQADAVPDQPQRSGGPERVELPLSAELAAIGKRL